MRNYIYACVAALALVCGTLSSCSNETDEVSAQNGGLVSFSIDNNASRVYRDSTDPLQLKWEEGDKVQIYSPECTTQSGSHFATYKVHIDDNGKAKLQYNASGLVWPDEEKKCRFYGTLGEAFYTDGITAYDDGCLLFTRRVSPNEVSDVGNRNIFLLAKAENVDCGKPVSFSFKSLSTTICLQITNQTGEDIRMEYLTYGFANKSVSENYSFLYKWDIVNNKLSADNEYTIKPLVESNLYSNPPLLKKNETRQLEEDITLSPNHIFTSNNQKIIEIVYYDAAGTEHIKYVDLSSYSFKPGTFNKIAIDITGE